MNSFGIMRQFSAAASKTVPPKNIKIEAAVKRSPTAVLEALSSTVGVDSTAPHFALIDDPAMIPSSAATRKNYFFAKEMGKRAARQLAEEWPTLFAFDRDQPELPVFRPTKAADPLQVNPTEGSLIKMIEEREVKDAVLLYERMRSQNVDVSDKTQLELFKLVTYYNNTNPPFAEVEEWHGLRNFGETEESKWTSGGLADLLFETLPQTPETISIMVCGLCKHKSGESVARADALYKEHQKSLHRNAFDSLITVSQFDKAQSILKDMRAEGVSPTLNTFHALLTSATKGKDVSKRRDLITAVIGEMQALSITPSLTTFDIILRNSTAEFPSDEEITKEDNPKVKNLKVAVTWLAEILTDLEARPSLTLEGANDHLFFYSAMGIASRAGNLEVAERLVALYENKKNAVTMPAFTTEAMFYNRYLLLFVEATSSIEEVEQKYRSLVPRLVGVSRQLTKAVSDRLRDSPRFSFLLRVTEDGIAARQLTDVRLGQLFRERLMDISYESLNVAERDEYAKLVRKMVDTLMEFSNFTGHRLQLKWHPTTLSECAVLLNRIGDSERAYSLLELLIDVEASQGDEAKVAATGHARPGPMSELFEDALRNHDVYKASTCLEVLSQFTPRAKLEPLAQRIHQMCKLTAEQQRLIDGFVRLRPE